MGAEGYAADLFKVINGSDDESPLARESSDLAEGVRARVGRDLLGGAAQLFARPGSITPESRIAFLRFQRGILGPAELTISSMFGGAEAAARRGATSFDRYMSERLARSSKRALANARTLRSGLAAANLALAKARSSSHIRDIVELLFAGHPLSVSSAARIFKISRLAARKHLLRLEADGLTESASRGKTGVVYIARDGLMTFYPANSPAPPTKASGRLAVSTGKPLSFEERARLEAIADDVADKVRDLDQLLLRLNPGARTS